METTPCTRFGITLAGALALIGASAKADTFGGGAFPFTINFVNIGNLGNGNDVNNPVEANTPGDGGTPFGGVAYGYRMGVTEISENMIALATYHGLDGVTAGPWTGNQPARDMTWFEAAAFVNWLNISTGHHVAYDVVRNPFIRGGFSFNIWSDSEAWDNDPGPSDELNRFRHKNAYYFLPSEDEWYKAAYHKNDGPTANYWDYATGSNTAPTPTRSGTGAAMAVYGLGFSFSDQAADVNLAGGLSPYGTRGQNGNESEWMESAYDEVNDTPIEFRVVRGGDLHTDEFALRSANRGGASPYLLVSAFRVASVAVVPEPSTALLLLGSGWMWMLKRRCRSGL